MSETKDTTLRDRLAEKAPYTPRIEFNCDGSQTHYQGCKCHEERHQAEVSRLKRQLEVAIKEFAAWAHQDVVSAKRTLAEIDRIGKEEV